MVKIIWKFYKFNLSLFASFYHVFAVQAFESNGRVSVTVMDGEEMVGQMAEQVGLIIIQVSSFLHSGDLLALLWEQCSRCSSVLRYIEYR